jgi:hypothetical protein
MCHSEPPTGLSSPIRFEFTNIDDRRGLSLIGQIGEVRKPYRDRLQRIIVGISRREVYPEVLKGSSK